MFVELLYWIVVGAVTGWLIVVALTENRTVKELKQKLQDVEARHVRDLRWHAMQRDALRVELKLCPPAVDKWVLGNVGLAEVFEVSTDKVSRILEMGVNFPSPFAYVDRTRIYDKDAVLMWYEEVYPRFKHLVR